MPNKIYLFLKILKHLNKEKAIARCDAYFKLKNKINSNHTSSLQMTFK
jgi:hypothetical protein